MFMPRYYAICVLVASNLLRSPLVVNVWQMCEEGRRREEGKINEDEKDPGVVAIRTWLSTLFKRKVEDKMVWKDEDTSPSPHFHDICAEIRDWRDEIYRFTIMRYSSLPFLEQFYPSKQFRPSSKRS